MFPPPAALLAFVTLTALLVITPGMSTALVLRNTAEGGKRAGVTTAAGIALGNASWALAAGAGLAAILSRQPGAMGVIRVAGAALLAWLGARSLWKARNLRRAAAGSGSGAAVPPHASAATPATMLGEGLVTNLLNPSVGVYYIGSVAQFVAPGPGFMARFYALGAIHVLMALACHSAYAVALGRVATALASRGRAWIMHAVTGLALFALAVQSASSVIRGWL
jgi:threonine/homoserine/homoserine lactone efflux protein